jgi:signal transduction histidine kinase
MLNNHRIRLSLRARVALGVALPIFIVLAFLSFLNYSREYNLLDEQARLDAVQLGDMMIHSLNHAMLTKEGEHLISSLGDISKLENIRLIQVVGSSGKILADSSGQEPKRIFNIEEDECSICHQYTVSERPRVIPLEQPVRGWRISAPIENLPQCHECHSKSNEHLGILLIDVSLSGKQDHLIADLRINLLISFFGTVLVSLMSYFLMHRLVVRRVEKFRRPLAEYANGQFKSRIPLETSINDELSELADTFNQMADELDRHAKQEMERHKLRDRAIVEERERIARELHDGLAQVLGYVNTKVMAARLLVRDHKLIEADEQLTHLEKAAKGLFLDVREAILGLKMAGKFQSSLTEAVEDYVGEFSRLSGIPTEFIADNSDESNKISPETELHLFRIVQESLNNVRKHSKASRAWVELASIDNFLELEIRDNGVGFDISLIKSNGTDRLGLKNMQERANQVGASFRIDTIMGEGTRVVVRLEVHEMETRQ